MPSYLNDLQALFGKQGSKEKGVGQMINKRALADEMEHKPAPYNPWPDAYKKIDQGASWLANQLPSPYPMVDEYGRVMDMDQQNLGKATTAMLPLIDPMARATPGTVGMFAGAASKKAIPEAFESAEQMRRAGMTSEEIWNALPAAQKLHFTPNDPKFKFEFSDVGAKLNNAALTDFLKSKVSGQQAKLGDILEHPELYEHYPDLKDMPVKRELLTGYTSGTQGYHRPAGPGYSAEMMLAYNRKRAEMLNTLLHETQHAIQSREGFVGGTSPRAVSDMAKGQAGLAEGMKQALSTKPEGMTTQGYNNFLQGVTDDAAQWNRIKESPYPAYYATEGEAYARTAPERGMTLSQDMLNKMYPLAENKLGDVPVEALANPNNPASYLNASLQNYYKQNVKPRSSESPLMDRLQSALKWSYLGIPAAGVAGSSDQTSGYPAQGIMGLIK